MTEASFQVLAAFAQEGLAALAFYRPPCLGKNLFDNARLLVLRPPDFVRVTNDHTHPLALQAADLLNSEVSLVCCWAV